MITFGIVCIVLGVVLFVLALPRNLAKIELEAANIKANLPEITGWSRFAVFILGILLIILGLVIGVTELFRSVSIPNSTVTFTIPTAVAVLTNPVALTPIIPTSTSTSIPANPTSTFMPEATNTDRPLPIATNTPLPIPTDTPELPIPAPTNTNVLALSAPDDDCDQRKEVREAANSNETRIYVRCPIGEIQYSLQTDDLLESVVLQCPGKDDQLIEFKLNEERSKGEQLPTYDTIKFISYPTCKVSIRVNNDDGPVGYTIWREIVGSLP